LFIQSSSAKGWKVACLEEIGYANGWISKEQVAAQAERLKKTGYGQYLQKLLEVGLTESLVLTLAR
jgi:glucose-1-phosphate thymidylyltransferase